MSVELTRQVLICGGFLTVGLNLAIIREAPRMVEAVAAWRLYMAGQIFVDLAIIYGLHRHIHKPIGVGVILTGIGIALTLVSLLMLESAYHRKRDHQQEGRNASVHLKSR
jgi:hypothetical protein